MYVTNSETGENVFAYISPVAVKDVGAINKSKRFNFNWAKEKGFNIYKLSVSGVPEPLGLMSSADRYDDLAIEIRLLALAKENIGTTRKYDRVAGCLIAFACKESFIAGYEGFVCLKSKTRLKKHYFNKYGLRPTNLYFVTEGVNSLKLIEEYYEN